MAHPQRAEPGPGQESVWDYPRPPRLEPVAERLRVAFAGQLIADSRAGWRVLETSHPPAYYIPPQDIRLDALRPAPGGSWCEWKGRAAYWTLELDGRIAPNAAWSYPDPVPAFRAIAGCLAFYAGRVDACWVGEERVRPQPGDFYGGWVTDRVVGPFKGAPETRGW
ncbi:hypothetical protein CR162_09155 [Pseudoroseomonas rhizosphaerae]|uniref:DUF427 domain-containing protein n=1 Tax=Teichococcus rhizosphaerae TaxID=1335062 RepID=A0A2C7ADX6_9PROT|nr:DUF427 domain-containing protein [Pseudoroseomonas rhizosphaerae]PHK95326.1 hypothetical protein CR162_09155 [Pseudoroseomonas rhizosphaerae]